MEAYRAAAEAIRAVLAGKTSIKTAVYSCAGAAGRGKGGDGRSASAAGGHGASSINVGKVYALVSNTLKRKQGLQHVVDTVPALAEADIGDAELLLVQLNDAVEGRELSGGGRLKRLLVEHREEIAKAYKQYVAERGEDEGGAGAGAGGDSGDSGAKMPRYARVNTAVCSVQEAVKQLTGQDSKEAASSSTSAHLSPQEVVLDPLMPYLLQLPETAHGRLSLHSHPLVTRGALVLQDKASCFPAHALLEDLLFQGGAGTGAAAEAGAEAGAKQVKKKGTAVNSSASSSAAATPGPSISASASASAAALLHGPAFDAIDACAAPGNKTSQLCALIQLLNERKASAAGDGDAAGSVAAGGKLSGKKRARAEEGAAADTAAASLPSSFHSRVLAFDRDPKRCQLLRNRMTQMQVLAEGGKGAPSSSPLSASCRVEATCADFLSLDPADPQFANVKVVLLDPSCSGSGMTAQHQETGLVGLAGLVQGGGKAGGKEGQVLPESAAPAATAAASVPRAPDSMKQRVQSLAAFQYRALLHALSFPAVQRVSYSTCSSYAEEDEDVVAAVLAVVNSSVEVEGEVKGQEKEGDVNEESAAAAAAGVVTAAAAPSSFSAAPKVKLLHILPSWHRRGFPLLPSSSATSSSAALASDASGAAVASSSKQRLLSAEDAACCVRAFPDADGTHGFFTAVFEKLSHDQQLLSRIAGALGKGKGKGKGKERDRGAEGWEGGGHSHAFSKGAYSSAGFKKQRSEHGTPSYSSSSAGAAKPSALPAPPQPRKPSASAAAQKKKADMSAKIASIRVPNMGGAGGGAGGKAKAKKL